MSECDSGVDTGSESNQSNMMSVETPPRQVEEEEDIKDNNDVSHQSPVAGPSHMSIDFPVANLQPLESGFSNSFYKEWFCIPYAGHKLKLIASRSKKPIHRKNFNVYTKMYGVIGERKLRKAVMANSVEHVHDLLDNGIDPCAADEKRRTALHFAACQGHTEIARILIDRGADVNQQDILGNTPLHLAVCTSNVEMVTLLLKAGTNVNAFNNSGRSPLHLAQSKLKLLQVNKSYSSHQLKTEIMHVLEMMQVYLQKSGEAVGCDFLNVFSNRLQHRQTLEEVNTDVNDLLSSLSHLSLHKA